MPETWEFSTSAISPGWYLDTANCDTWQQEMLGFVFN
jgi:hypothetical protein